VNFPQHLVRVTGRVVLGASLALTALCIADANPAGASRGGGDQEIEDAGTPVTTPTTEATTTTTATTAVPQADPNTGDAGEGQDTQAPAEPVVEAAADPVEEPMATLAEVVPAPQPRPSLPRTGAGSVAQEALLGFGLVGAGLAATAAGRRNRRVQA
jgi:hypothetical protein